MHHVIQVNVRVNKPLPSGKHSPLERGRAVQLIRSHEKPDFKAKSIPKAEKNGDSLP
jgi:hypothetical protein